MAGFAGSSTVAAELVLRAVLEVAIAVLDRQTPFVRAIQTVEWHKYNFPYAKKERVPFNVVLIGGAVGCLIIAVIHLCVIYIARHNIRRVLQLKKAVNLEEEEAADLEEQDGHINSRSDADKYKINRNYPLSAISYHSNSSIARICLKEFGRFVFSASLSILLAGFIVGGVKNLVGRPRPDFLDRCNPPGFDPAAGNFEVLGAVPACLTRLSARAMDDGRRSFPSGHSACSWAACLWIALFLYYQLLPLFSCYALPVLVPWIMKSAVRFSVSASVCILSTYTAISRTMDYRHHWQDVLVGSILGIGCAIFAFHLYYSSDNVESADFKLPAIARQDRFRAKNGNGTLEGARNMTVAYAAVPISAGQQP